MWYLILLIPDLCTHTYVFSDMFICFQTKRLLDKKLLDRLDKLLEDAYAKAEVNYCSSHTIDEKIE